MCDVCSKDLHHGDERKEKCRNWQCFDLRSFVQNLAVHQTGPGVKRVNHFPIIYGEMLHVGHEKNHPGHVDLSNLMAEIFFVCDISKSFCKMVETGPIFFSHFLPLDTESLKMGFLSTLTKCGSTMTTSQRFFPWRSTYLWDDLRPDVNVTVVWSLTAVTIINQLTLLVEKLPTPTQIGSAGSDRILPGPQHFSSGFLHESCEKTTSRV